MGSEKSNHAPTVLFGRESSASREKSVSFMDKENISENTPVATNILAEQKPSYAVLPMRSSLKKKAETSEFKVEMNRLRAASPLRKDLVKKTQEAISNASTSVKQSLTAPFKNKEEEEMGASNLTKKVRFQWREDYEGAKRFHESKESNRRQILQLQRKLASQHFKEKAKSEKIKRKQHIEKVEEEYIFNSEVYREHQQKLKEEREKNRKQSIDARAKIRKNNKEGTEKLKMMKIEEDNAIFDVRYDLHKAAQEAQKQNAVERRKSFQFRLGDAKRIRNLRENWKEEELKKEQESFELKRAAARDVDNYKKRIEKERRESLAGRGREARKLQKEKMKKLALEAARDHESYELKWAGEKDAEEYHRKVNEERRKSLANRNMESARHAQAMKELRNIAKEKAAESFMLKWAAENDAKEYLAKMAAERRKSLQFRGDEHKRVRKYEDEQHQQQLIEKFVEGQLQSECKYLTEHFICVTKLF